MVAASALLATSVLADDGTYEEPLRLVDRPLTLPRFTVRGDLGISDLHVAGGTNFSAATLSGGYGVTNDLELDTALVPLSLSPSLQYGNPSVSATYRWFHQDGLELGAGLGATVITQNQSFAGDLIVQPAASALYHLGPIRLDAFLGLPVTLGGPASVVGLSLPVTATYQLDDHFYVGGQTGLGVVSFSSAASSTYFPLEAFAGYSFKRGCQGVFDVRAGLGFPELIVPGGMSVVDTDDFSGYLEGTWFWGATCDNTVKEEPPDPCHSTVSDGTPSFDYGKGKGTTPKPPGRVFNFPKAENTGAGTGVRDTFTLLDFYLGGAGRTSLGSRAATILSGSAVGGVGAGAVATPGAGSVAGSAPQVDDFGMPHQVPASDPPLDTDSVIFEGDMLDYIQQQSQVIALAGTAEVTLRADAAQASKQLACDQSATFTDHGQEVVMGDATATTISLSLGSFSVYWDATCEIGPKKCCVASTSCDSGQGTSASYTCRIKWTQFDIYNFAHETGTGGTGWLKILNPVGWFGTKFFDFGFWDSVVNGFQRSCM